MTALSLAEILHGLRLNPDFMACVEAWQRFPPRPGEPAALQAEVDPRIYHALQKRGVSSLYTHQAAAIDAGLAGENVVVATPTATVVVSTLDRVTKSR